MTRFAGELSCAAGDSRPGREETEELLDAPCSTLQCVDVPQTVFFYHYNNYSAAAAL
ncbi:hypothetical protein NQZ68_031549 [Dissostichus eleginoides]|nr:hypothetical protein NQZ68_031549 [Dissostichus eleginoides]